MALFEKALEAPVMSTHLLIRANVSKSILYQAYQIATDFEKRYSAYKEDSFLNSINKNAGKNAITCTSDDFKLFQMALKLSKLTKGAFDISIGAVSHGAYHFGFHNQHQASDEEIAKQKSLINYKDVILTPSTIMLKHKGMRLDIGGIGKGYVAREIALFLAQKGATKILVDVGGEIVTRGKSYTIAIKDPFNDGNIAHLKTSKEDISISTSGSYERYIDKQNHHILDTKEGHSAKYYTSMTIMRNGWHIDHLDAYATALFNLNPQSMTQECDNFNLTSITIDTKSQISLYNIDKLSIDSLIF